MFKILSLFVIMGLAAIPAMASQHILLKLKVQIKDQDEVSATLSLKDGVEDEFKVDEHFKLKITVSSEEKGIWRVRGVLSEDDAQNGSFLFLLRDGVVGEVEKRSVDESGENGILDYKVKMIATKKI